MGHKAQLQKIPAAFCECKVSAFFDDKDDSNIIDELNSLIMASSQDHNLISVNTNSAFNETKTIEQKVA